jgi:hypothetical protein
VRGGEGRYDGAPPLSFPPAKPFRGAGEGSGQKAQAVMSVPKRKVRLCPVVLPVSPAVRGAQTGVRKGSSSMTVVLLVRARPRRPRWDSDARRGKACPCVGGRPLGYGRGRDRQAEELMTAPKEKKSLCLLFFGSTTRFCGLGEGAEGRNHGAPSLSFPLAKPFRGAGEGSDDLAVRSVCWARRDPVGPPGTPTA